VQVYELPQQQVASAVHHGDFEGFTQVHTAILTWIEANGYTVTGPYREIYVQNNTGNATESVTELQYPVNRD
jgi:effector-binding domain-containing protein